MSLTPQPWTMDRSLTPNEAHEVGRLLCLASRGSPGPEIMAAMTILSDAGHQGCKSYVESYKRHQRERDHA